MYTHATSSLLSSLLSFCCRLLVRSLARSQAPRVFLMRKPKSPIKLVIAEIYGDLVIVSEVHYNHKGNYLKPSNSLLQSAISLEEVPSEDLVEVTLAGCDLTAGSPRYRALPTSVLQDIADLSYFKAEIKRIIISTLKYESAISCRLSCLSVFFLFHR